MTDLIDRVASFNFSISADEAMSLAQMKPEDYADVIAYVVERDEEDFSVQPIPVRVTELQLLALEERTMTGKLYYTLVLVVQQNPVINNEEFKGLLDILKG